MARGGERVQWERVQSERTCRAGVFRTLAPKSSVKKKSPKKVTGKKWYQLMTSRDGCPGNQMGRSLDPKSRLVSFNYSATGFHSELTGAT